MAEKGNKKPETNLVEVVSLLFIVAVLFTVILPSWGLVQAQAKERANLLQCQQNLLQLRDGLEKYRQARQGRFPPTLATLVEQEMLSEMPRCPSSEKQTYTGKGYRYKSGDPGRYTIMCIGNHHVEVGAGPNEPSYDSLYGMRPAMEAVAATPSPSPSPSPTGQPDK